jgi:hypothetical protein
MVMLFAGLSMAANVTLSNLTQTYNGKSKTVTVTTVPAGLNVLVTYAGSTTPPINVGNYTVSAIVNDPVETGSASGTLRINKGNQTITIAPLPAKTYGDLPFTVTASANSGLPITKWESSDPAVATISPSGEVTLVGAGQTSIIASNSGDANYNAAWIAKPLNVARSATPLPSGTRTVTYNGSPQGLAPAAFPSGLATEITYCDTGLASLVESEPTPEVVFQNGPDTLNIVYLSTAMQANGLSGMAKYVNLGGSARKLHSCDVTLVTYSRYDTSSPYGYKSWADQNPALVVPPTSGVSIPGNSGGWYHPVTLSFYDYFNDGVTETYRLLTSQTVQAFIPWRPAKDANGNNYSYQSYPFRVPFTFPDGVILPQEVWVAVSFNTQSYGASPIGSAGPYNALNISYPDGQQAGSTLFPNLQLLYKNWRWLSASGGIGPMLRLRAVPANASPAAPVQPGTYEVKTQAAAFGTDGSSSSILRIGHTFASWQANRFANTGLPPEKTTDTADPDGDGLSNFLEYAANLDPLLGDHPSPVVFEPDGNTLSFAYRRNLHALDLDYTIQHSTRLVDPLSWDAVTPISETTVSDDGSTQVIQATLEKPADSPCYFLRLQVRR